MNDVLYFKCLDGSICDSYEIARTVYVRTGMRIDPKNKDDILRLAIGYNGIKKNENGKPIGYDLSKGEKS